MKKILTPKISEILEAEFMIPLNLSADTLAKNSHLSLATVQAILNDHQPITPDIANKLGRFFGVSDRYFMNLQIDIDFRSTARKIDDDQIRRYQS